MKTAIADDDFNEPCGCSVCTNDWSDQKIKTITEGMEEHLDYTATQVLISNVCERLKELLIEKNRKYGNSALEPIRIFSTSDPGEQILVRIDDKLNRLKNMQVDEDEDLIWDLMGYLVLYRVHQIMHEDL